MRHGNGPAKRMQLKIKRSGIRRHRIKHIGKGNFEALKNLAVKAHGHFFPIAHGHIGKGLLHSGGQARLDGNALLFHDA